jgi:hypothetical protein
MEIVIFILGLYAIARIKSRIENGDWGISERDRKGDALLKKYYVGGGIFSSGHWTDDAAEQQHKQIYGRE